jgi:hypothetical protein
MTALAIMAMVQGVYFALTGLWPLVHLRSFLAVTGPKTDLWLVHTVGVIVLCIGTALLVATARGEVNGTIIALAVTSALGLATIDVIYVVRRVIAPIYLVDAAAEVLLVTGWLISVSLM